MSRAHVLDRADQVEQVSPAAAVEDDAVRGLRATRGDGRQHERLGADRGQPARVAVDVGELRAADVVVMENRVGLA